MKLLLIIFFISSSALAQKKVTKDVYELVGFPPPTTQEIKTFYEDTYYMLEHAAQKRSLRQTPKFGMYNAEDAWLEDPMRFLYGLTNGRMAMSGDPNQSRHMGYPVYPGSGPGKQIVCYTQGPPAADSDMGNKGNMEQDFTSAHHELIASNDANLSKLEAAAGDACGIYAKVMHKTKTGAFNSVVIDRGFNGVSVIRTVKEVESLAEALPLMTFSVARNRELARDNTSQGFGSSNGGTDAMANQIEQDLLEKHNQKFDGNRFAGVWNNKSGNPYLRMRGSKEGKKSSESEDAGSAGVIMWELCIETSSAPAEVQPASTPNKVSTPKKDNFNLLNQNVAIELPDNIVSPYPLVVKNGVISGADVAGTPSKQGYLFGPRASELSQADQEKMEVAAAAMSNKARSFVTGLIDNPGEVINLEKSQLLVASCSNYLKNGESFSNWSTDKDPTGSGSASITFEELSKERANAQLIVMNELIKKEVQDKITALDSDKKIAIAKSITLANDPNRRNAAKRESNRAAYIETQLAKLKSFNPTKLKATKVDCSVGAEKGVAGPNPYFTDLRSNGLYEWPKFQASNPSAYYLQVQAISEKLKRKDVEDKLKETKAAIKSLVKSETSKIKSQILEQLASKYQQILAKTDGSPSYLDIPPFSRGW